MKLIKPLLFAAALSMCAVSAPAHAQYGSGSNYGTNTTKSQTSKAAKKEAKRKAMEEASRKKDEYERQLAAQETDKMEKSYGSGTDGQAMTEEAKMKKDEMAKSYGSGTDGKVMSEEAKSYGSGTDGEMLAKDKMIKKDHMMDKSYGSGAPVGKPTNCPANTQAQDNGTCMLISGNLPIN